MYELMTKIALTFSVFNLVILCFLLTKMIDYRDKAFAVYHFLRSHCAALVELDRFINGEVKNESKAPHIGGALYLFKEQTNNPTYERYN